MSFQRRAARSSAAPVLAWGLRAKYLIHEEALNLASASRWLVTSREHTNFTYDLTPLSLKYLAAFVSTVSGAPIPVIQGYLHEIAGDASLFDHVKAETAKSDRRRISDPRTRIGRRAGWYALVRALRPNLVVETGTDKGLGSVVLASALLRNGSGQLVTMDINDESGFLIAGPYAEVVDRQIGSSLSLLREVGDVDMFIHDSNHDPAYELEEFLAVEGGLSDHAVVLTDNSSVSSALFDWSVNRHRQFLDFREEPTVRALRPEGIGASWCLRED